MKLMDPVTNKFLIWASIVSSAIAVVAILFSLVAMAAAVDSPAPDRARIVRWFEDGSGRIRLSNGYCTFPAFDSPEDKVLCVREK